MLNSNFFWNTVMILGITIEWYIFKFIGDRMFNIRKGEHVKKIILLLLISMTATLVITNVFINIKLAIVMTMGWVFYIYSYDCKLLKALIVNLVYWMILMGLDFISFNIVLTLNEIININELFKNSIPKLELIIISKLLLILVVPILNSLDKNIEFKKREALYIIILILTNILSILVIFTLSMNYIKKSPLEDLIILIVSVMLILSNISLIKVIGKIIKSNIIELENELIRDNIDMQYQHYLNVQEAQFKVRKLYHDMKNHMTCIKKLYGNSMEVDMYIDNIKSELNDYKHIIHTGSMVLDIIINDKIRICNENNINSEIEIDFSRCNFMDVVDVCSIFSNLIDNAIESSLKLEEMNRFIRLKGTCVNKFFVLKIENNKLNNVIRGKEITTDKKDKFLHGIGIKSIKSSVEKYNGEMNIDFTDDKFKVQIYIPI